MAKPDEFELLIKMNRLPPPSVLTSPLPVKYREVRYDPRHNDQTNEEKTDEHLKPDFESSPLPPTGHIFFKDPLCPPDLAVVCNEEPETDGFFSPMKLGRNMRASHHQFGSSRKKGVCDLMNERKKLLHQQKEQQAEVSKEADSELTATALVNDLMQQGFHITPPEHTPRGSCVSSSQPQHGSLSGVGDSQWEEGRKARPEDEESRLVMAIHREVKRVTCTNIAEEPS